MTILTVMGEAALRSCALALAAAVCLRLLGLRHVRVEKRVWTAVLVLAAAMPLAVMWRLPRLTLAAYPEQSPVYAAPSIASERAAAEVPASPPSVPAASRLPRAIVPVKPEAAPPRVRLALLLYLLTASAMLARMGAGLALAARLWRRAKPFAFEGEVLPRVRVTGAVRSPVTFGSGILMPLEAIGWSEATLRPVLAHEGTHVREGDFYLQLAARLHLAVFPFSPLAWWLPGKLARLSETMCDRAAVVSSGDSFEYAQLLLRFAARPTPVLPFTAMARSAGVAERVERLLADPGLGGFFRLRRGQLPGLVLTVAAASIAAGATLRIVRPERLVLAQTRIAAPPQEAPAPPAEPVPAIRSKKPKPAEPPVSLTVGDSEDTADNYAIEGPDGTRDLTIHGWYSDSGQFGKAQSKSGSIRFTRDGKAWVIEDPALVKEALAAYAPVRELGRQQAELGKRQGELGGLQGQLGAQQGLLGAKEAALSAGITGLTPPELPRVQVDLPKDFGVDLSKLVNDEMRLALHGEELSPEERGRLEKERGELQEKVEAMHKEMDRLQPQLEVSAHKVEQASKRLQQQLQPLTEQMTALARQQGELGGQQAKLGAQQAALGARQAARSAEADRKVRALIDRAVREGKAHPVK